MTDTTAIIILFATVAVWALGLAIIAECQCRRAERREVELREDCFRLRRDADYWRRQAEQRREIHQRQGEPSRN